MHIKKYSKSCIVKILRKFMRGVPLALTAGSAGVGVAKAFVSLRNF